ncbi:MAG: hypothetical protein HY784_12500 [Chloroflexi bacterium]|nr:hypothetical protein [Chloroflexota bacterium]
MPTLIDGHNLIGALPDISLQDPDDEQKLVDLLHRWCVRTGKSVRVVFDPGPPGGQPLRSTSRVNVPASCAPPRRQPAHPPTRNRPRRKSRKCWPFFAGAGAKSLIEPAETHPPLIFA